jgi:hypothetical protein
MLQPVNKKAVSEMVSYVLLIVIAIGISALVYPYLKSHLFNPNAVPECKEEVSVIAKEISCHSQSSVSFFLQNRGLWTVSQVIVRVKDDTGKIQKLSDNVLGLSTASGSLAPDQITNEITLDAILSATGNQLEIEPIQTNEGRKAVCTNALVVQKFDC